MKKILLVSLLAFFAACKTPAPVAATNVDRKSQVAIKGNWTIASVTYMGSEMFKITSFDAADSKCFEGSTWKFISNNDSGDMALTQANCTNFASKIKWYVNKEGQFVLKFLDEGVKARKMQQGYILTVADQTAESFKLIDKVNIGGKMTNVVYQFKKSN
ncbi:lipocalin family protein [Flavobacterium psychrophilum]|uniref:lipocalin family protein n=1 Tax=Flavobacterium psychrophilum TaxID=96345 RepID=UPI000B7C4417|nr:lipocalin family protein [Flavobacterium psychrophilum]SNB35549.1 putative lipoprotein [Flavobacterium psychrophilum]